MKKGKNYRIVDLKNSIADTIQLGVCWEGSYDVSDYVTNNDIIFDLTEEKFEEYVSSFEKIKSFVKNNGFVINFDMLKKT